MVMTRAVIALIAPDSFCTGIQYQLHTDTIQHREKGRRQREQATMGMIEDLTD